MSNPHMSTAHAIGAKQAQEDTHKVAYQQGSEQALEDFGITKTAISDELKYRAAWEAKLRRTALQNILQEMDAVDLDATHDGRVTRNQLAESANRRLRQERTFRGTDIFDEDFPRFSRAPDASAAAAQNVENIALKDTGILDDYRANHTMPIQGRGGNAQRWREEAAAALQAEQAAESAKRPTRIPGFFDRLTETPTGRSKLLAALLGTAGVGAGAYYGLKED